jgi:hypothetical protein
MLSNYLRLIPIFLLSCNITKHFPREIYVDSNATQDQYQSVVESIEKWNVLGRKCFGYDIIINKGIIIDKFDPINSLNDNKSVMYFIQENTNTEKSYLMLDSQILGETFPNDILVYVGGVKQHCVDLFSKKMCDKNTVFIEGLINYIPFHELGHFVNIIGHDNRESILMNSDGGTVYTDGCNLTTDNPTELQSGDIALFVANNGCPLYNDKIPE